MTVTTAMTSLSAIKATETSAFENTISNFEEQLESLGRVVDLEAYPVHDLEHPVTLALIERCRAQLDDTGCSVIADFVKPESLQRMQEEARRLMPCIFRSEQKHNPYMTKEDGELPDSHPNHYLQRRTAGFINSDIIPQESDMLALYDNDIMTRFIGACLGTWPIYTWADPLARCPYGVLEDGDYFPWHFDGNEFTVSVSVEQPTEGGVFEYAPNIRSVENENLEGVNRVLDGDKEGVYELEWKPGYLQLFKGRYTLHRVQEVKGPGAWITALPTYMTDPDTVNRPEHSKQFYGRALPIHYEREANRPDSLTD
ncbi:MAG: hypothetical protein OIF55_00995 [Amphritea sp.]|nr:hypothetical protein [Amphritea sp.]